MLHVHAQCPRGPDAGAGSGTAVRGGWDSWVLKTESGSSARTPSALSHQAISSLVFKKMYMRNALLDGDSICFYSQPLGGRGRRSRTAKAIKGNPVSSNK